VLYTSYIQDISTRISGVDFHASLLVS